LYNAKCVIGDKLLELELEKKMKKGGLPTPPALRRFSFVSIRPFNIYLKTNLKKELNCNFLEFSLKAYTPQIGHK
jgi:hypothetical protein